MKAVCHPLPYGSSSFLTGNEMEKGKKVMMSQKSPGGDPRMRGDDESEETIVFSRSSFLSSHCVK